jgi:hypothetical protein
MTDHSTEPLPGLKARVAGLLYLLKIAGCLHLRIRPIHDGHARRRGQDGGQHSPACATLSIRVCCGTRASFVQPSLALIFYDLFKVANRSLSALIAFFILVATAIESANLLNYYAPLILLEGAASSAFKPEQLHAFAYMSLALHAIGFNLAVVFFALYDLLIGYLVFRSGFLPRILGVLMAVAGLCYLVSSFASFLDPRFAAHLLPYILIPSAVGELALCLWLLVMGVDNENWSKQAYAA